MTHLSLESFRNLSTSLILLATENLELSRTSSRDLRNVSDLIETQTQNLYNVSVSSELSNDYLEDIAVAMRRLENDTRRQSALSIEYLSNVSLALRDLRGFSGNQRRMNSVDDRSKVIVTNEFR